MNAIFFAIKLNAIFLASKSHIGGGGEGEGEGLTEELGLKDLEILGEIEGLKDFEILGLGPVGEGEAEIEGEGERLTLGLRLKLGEGEIEGEGPVGEGEAEIEGEGERLTLGERLGDGQELVTTVPWLHIPLSHVQSAPDLTQIPPLSSFHATSAVSLNPTASIGGQSGLFDKACFHTAHSIELFMIFSNQYWPEQVRETVRLPEI